MKSGKSINRPVLARRLELDKRRHDYKMHLRKIKDQKCATDFSHPPIVFRIEYIQRKNTIQRRERQQYEDMCIEVMNEHYENKIINSRCFHDQKSIDQINQNKRKRKSTSSSQIIAPQKLYQSCKSARSSRSASRNYSSSCEKDAVAFKQVAGFAIPHYDLPEKFLDIEIESTAEEKSDKNNDIKTHADSDSENKKKSSPRKIKRRVNTNREEEVNEKSNLKKEKSNSVIESQVNLINKNLISNQEKESKNNENLEAKSNLKIDKEEKQNSNIAKEELNSTITNDESEINISNIGNESILIQLKEVKIESNTEIEMKSDINLNTDQQKIVESNNENEKNIHETENLSEKSFCIHPPETKPSVAPPRQSSASANNAVSGDDKS